MGNPFSVSAADTLPPMVLLVEGEPHILAAHSRDLESAGLWVTTATNPADGLSYVRELLPNLLITEITFGGRSAGVDLIHAVKDHGGTTHIPIVALSGTALEDLPSDTQRETALVLRTPVRPELLQERARSVLATSATVLRRSNTAVRRAYRLLAQNRASREQGREFLEQLRRQMRACPTCGVPLEWLERTTVAGIDYDCYRACPHGCGAYCFDRRSREWICLKRER